METSRLKIGDTYKYKNLCELLGEKNKTGKSKQLQLKEWNRYFSWKNPTSQKYVITEIFTKPQEKIEHRGGTRINAGAKNVYGELGREHIKSLIATYLSEYKGHVYMFQNQGYQFLSLRNSNLYNMHDKAVIKSLIGFSHSVFTSIESLNDNNLSIRKFTMVRVFDNTNTLVWREANIYEMKRISYVEKDARKNNPRKKYNAGLAVSPIGVRQEKYDFLDISHIELAKEGITNYFKGMEIVWNKNYIVDISDTASIDFINLMRDRYTKNTNSSSTISNKYIKLNSFYECNCSKSKRGLEKVAEEFEKTRADKQLKIEEDKEKNAIAIESKKKFNEMFSQKLKKDITDNLCSFNKLGINRGKGAQAICKDITSLSRKLNPDDSSYGNEDAIDEQIERKVYELALSYVNKELFCTNESYITQTIKLIDTIKIAIISSQERIINKCLESIQNDIDKLNRIEHSILH